MEHIGWVAAVIGLSALVQSLAGFGFALVAIALLPFFLDLSLAVPLVLLTCLLNSLALWIYYRASFQWQAIAPLVFSALLCIPIGLVGLHYVPENLTRKLLGSLIVLYVAYDIVRQVAPAASMPAFASPRWAYLFGGISGFLTGAFTTGGPPLVMYANSNGWSPEEFKGNLPGVYAIALTFALTGHYFEGHLTGGLWKLALYSLPAFGLGMGLGIALSKQIDANGFKRLVLCLLGLIGLRLIW